MPTLKVLNLVSKTAQDLGHTVEPLRVGGDGALMSKKLLRINGKLCCIHALATSSILSSGSSSEYLRLRISLSTLRRVRFIIVVQQTSRTPRFMVVPSLKLRKCFGKHETIKTFYIRADSPATTTKRQLPCVEFHDYIDAWHLLKPKDRPS